MKSYVILLLLSLLLLTPAYISFRRQMRKIKREVFGPGSVAHERKRDFIREEPGDKITIMGIPFVYVVIFIIFLWGAAVSHYVWTTMMQ